MSVYSSRIAELVEIDTSLEHKTVAILDLGKWVVPFLRFVDQLVEY